MEQSEISFFIKEETNVDTFDYKGFGLFAIAVTLLMAGNAFSGAMKARTQGTFSWQTLLNGCINYALWLATILCLVAAVQMWGGNLSVTLDNKQYSLLEVVEIAKEGVYLTWAVKLVQNVYEYAGIKKNIKLANQGEEVLSTFPQSGTAIIPDSSTQLQLKAEGGIG